MRFLPFCRAGRGARLSLNHRKCQYGLVILNKPDVGSGSEGKGRAMDLTPAQRAELADIGFHWDSAYLLAHDGTNYTATRIGSPDHVVSAPTAGELRHLVRSDYFAWMATLSEHMST
jgi:hypothetical protein